MQTSSRRVPAGALELELRPAGLLSLAMTALRLTAPAAVHPRDRTIALDEVAWHDSRKDCWVVIYDRVYDLTHFFNEHPGGAEVLLEHAGRDATVAFRGVGHSAAAVRSLDRYLLGELPPHERIFRTAGGIRLSEIPA